MLQDALSVVQHKPCNEYALHGDSGCYSHGLLGKLLALLGYEASKPKQPYTQQPCLLGSEVVIPLAFLIDA